MTAGPDLAAVRADHIKATLRWVCSLGTGSIVVACPPSAAGMGAISLEVSELLAFLDRVDAQAAALAREREEHDAFRHVVRDVFWAAKIPAPLLINDLEILEKIHVALAEGVAQRRRAEKAEREYESLGNRFERALSILSEFVSPKPCVTDEHNMCFSHRWRGPRPCPQSRIQDFRLVRGSTDQDIIMPGLECPEVQDLATPDPAATEGGT